MELCNIVGRLDRPAGDFLLSYYVVSKYSVEGDWRLAHFNLVLLLTMIVIH